MYPLRLEWKSSPPNKERQQLCDEISKKEHELGLLYERCGKLCQDTFRKEALHGIKALNLADRVSKLPLLVAHAQFTDSEQCICGCNHHILEETVIDGHKIETGTLCIALRLPSSRALDRFTPVTSPTAFLTDITINRRSIRHDLKIPFDQLVDLTYLPQAISYEINKRLTRETMEEFETFELVQYCWLFTPIT